MSKKIAAGIPTTAKGKGKDQYGRKFGKKHNEVEYLFFNYAYSNPIHSYIPYLACAHSHNMNMKHCHGFLTFLLVS